MKDTDKNIVFISEGGLGKVIASTAVIKRLKETYPDKRIIVVSGYPEIFQYNPRVYKSYSFDNPLHLYDDYIQEGSHILKCEPYIDTEYIMGREHLLQVWCRLAGVTWDKALPELFFVENEIEASRMYVEKLTKNGKKNFVLFQWTGGLVPEDKDPMKYHETRMRMHRRSLPQKTAQQIVNHLVRSNSVVGLVQHDNMPVLDGAEKVFFPIRGVLALLKHCEGFIGIDSFLQHAAPAFGTKGVVVWGGTHPDRLGYEVHTNIFKQVCDRPGCHRPDSFLFDGNPKTGLWNCPHSEACLKLDAEEIYNEYVKTVEPKGGDRDTERAKK